MKRSSAYPFSPASCPVYYGWPILAVGTLGILMSTPGQTMGVSVFTDHLIDALGVTRSRLSQAYMLGTLGCGLLLPLAGRLYDRFGARAVASVACASLGIVLLALSRADRLSAAISDATGAGGATVAFLVMIPAFFALRFWGQGVLTLVSRSMVAKWFDRRLGLVTGVSGVFVAFAFSASPLALDRMIAGLGWRGAWATLGLVIGIGFLAMTLVFYRDNPVDCGLHIDGASPDSGPSTTYAAPEKTGLTLAEARKTYVFWTFCLGLGMSGLYTTGLTFHVVSIFDNSGMSRQVAVGIFLPASAVAVAVQLAGGWLSDRCDLKWLLAAMLAGLGVSMLALAGLSAGASYWLLIAGNGVAGGLFPVLMAVVWAKLFGQRELGAISGTSMAVVVIASALGPALFSESLARFGSYAPAAIACCAVTGLLMLAAVVSQPSAFKISGPDGQEAEPAPAAV